MVRSEGEAAPLGVVREELGEGAHVGAVALAGDQVQEGVLDEHGQGALEEGLLEGVQVLVHVLHHHHHDTTLRRRFHHAEAMWETTKRWRATSGGAAYRHTYLGEPGVGHVLGQVVVVHVVQAVRLQTDTNRHQIIRPCEPRAAEHTEASLPVLLPSRDAFI